MKNTFKLFLDKEIAKYNSILSTNSLSDEDKTQVEATIANLNEVAEALDAETDNEAVEELRQSVATLNESLTAIMEKINQRETNIEDNENEEKMENYLSTKNSVSDFVSAIRNSRNGAEFSRNWRNALSTNSIEVVEGSEFAFLPDLVRGKIQDLWDKKADWLADLKIVNAKGYTVRANGSDKTSETSRAKGWRPGCTKVDQEITVAAKKVLPQFIYKIQTLDAEMKFNDDGSLLDYLLEELVGQILYEEKRAILIGDGREEGCGHIDSIESIYKGENAVSDNFTTIVEAEQDSFMLDNLHNLVSQVKAEGEDVVLFIATSAINEATRVAASDTSTPLYLEDEQLARQCRATRIVVTDILDIAGITAIAMVPKKYVLVGENVLNPSLFNQHDIWTNTDVYRYECPVGGAIEGLKSTAVLKPYHA